jgi:hypothetical protein
MLSIAESLEIIIKELGILFWKYAEPNASDHKLRSVFCGHSLRIKLAQWGGFSLVFYLLWSGLPEMSGSPILTEE